MNINYVEYDPEFTFTASSLQHYELYDQAVDPFQMKNIYQVSSLVYPLLLRARIATGFSVVLSVNLAFVLSLSLSDMFSPSLDLMLALYRNRVLM